LIRASSLLLKKEKHLQKREEEINNASYLLNKQYNYMNEYKANEVLSLNIGGEHHCSTLRKTLCLFKSSTLAYKFSGKWDDNLEKDQDGNFFIDQPVELFRPLLNYLRAKSIEFAYENQSDDKHHNTSNIPPVSSPKVDDVLWHDFIRMIESYGLTQGVFPTTIKLHRGDPETANVVQTIDPNISIVSTKKWSTFIMIPHGHNREIKSFEIELGKVERPLIGWAKIQNKCVSTKDLFVPYYNNDNKYNYHSAKGVGEDKQSIALGHINTNNGNHSDIGMLMNGTFVTLGANSELNLKQGTKIRCEDRGKKWYVDDVLVAVGSNNAMKNKNQFSSRDKKKNDVTSDALSTTNRAITEFDLSVADAVPAFSGKGDWKITKVELDF